MQLLLRLCITQFYSILFSKKFLTMKLLGLIICFSLQLNASTYGQKVNLKRQNASLEDVFNDIHQQTGYLFLYSNHVVEEAPKLSIHIKDATIDQAMFKILVGKPLGYRIESKTIVVFPQEIPQPKLIRGSKNQETITGTVTDNKGEGIPGVSVTVKGTRLSAITDVNGNYSITAPGSDGTLVFSFIGYATLERPFSGAGPINVTLIEDNQALEEVVVIGYGTVRKSDLTGAVASVKEEQIQERGAPSLNQSLAGRMPGVQVNVNSGRPGGRTNIRIRGFSSINTSNNPLFVVDGVALPQSNLAQFSNPIDYINPNDIVSVEVLKDASSTAIYGARGANGVIMVTTRKGRSGDSRITYNTDFGVPTIGPNRPEVLNAKEYLAVEELAYKNMEKYDPTGWARGSYAQFNPATRRANAALRANGVFDANGNPLHDTDWLKAATQSKLSQNHQLGFSGGNDRTTYALSLGFRNDNGFIINSFMKRYSGRFTVEDQVKKWLKIGGTLSYNNQAENLVDIGNNIRQLVEDLPFLPLKYPDGTFANNRDYPGAEATFSSFHRLSNSKFNLNTQTTNGNFFSNINLFKGLEMRTVFGSNVIRQETNEFTARTIDIGNRGNAASRSQTETFWSLENYLTYNKKFTNSNLTALLGLSWQQNDGHNFRASAQGFDTDFYEFNNLGPGSGARGVSSASDDTDFGFESYFGRINYNLLDKYLFTLTGRADGTSRTGANKKFGYFPSAAFGWRVSNEEFWRKNDVISNLKLRTSYGLTGNSEIRSYEYLDLLGSNAAILNEVRVPGTGIGRLANPDLRWEKTAQADVGLELGLFNNRITLEADYYYRKTTDMLLSAPVPRTSGYSNVRRNIGSMANNGVELALNSVNVRGRDLSWNTSFNISFNRNKILSLATPADIIDVGGPNLTGVTNIIRVGEPAGSFYGLTRLGVWGTAEADEAAKFSSYRGGGKILPGDIKYLDVNGDYVINDLDRGIIGNGSPKAWGSLFNTFKYKNLDLLVDLQYSYGNDVMDLTLHPSEDRQALANSYRSVLNAWTPQNQNTMIAEVRGTQAGYTTNPDSHWVKDGSFIRGRNIMLGYTLSKNITDRMKIGSMRLYTSAQNLFLLVNDEVVGDPETTPIRGDEGANVFSQGQNYHGYPRPRTFMFGLQIGL